MAASNGNGNGNGGVWAKIGPAILAAFLSWIVAFVFYSNKAMDKEDFKELKADVKALQNDINTLKLDMKGVNTKLESAPRIYTNIPIEEDEKKHE